MISISQTSVGAGVGFGVGAGVGTGVLGAGVGLGVGELVGGTDPTMTSNLYSSSVEQTGPPSAFSALAVALAQYSSSVHNSNSPVVVVSKHSPGDNNRSSAGTPEIRSLISPLKSKRSSLRDKSTLPVLHASTS